MKITCQSCQSKYNVADEKVRGKIVKIRCRKCGATIVVHGNEGAAANGSAPAPAPVAPEGTALAAEGEWHVNLGETDQRTMTLAELVDAYNSSLVTQETFIWTDGMDDWKPLAEVDVVVNALHENANASPAAEPAYAAPVAAPPEEPVPEPAAARPLDVRGGYSSAFDDRSPVAAAAAPEAKRAAVRREGARGRDLFGGGGGLGTEEVQTSAPAMPQALGGATDGQGQLTGQRNENSVLFSLAVLTKNADERAPSQPPPARSNEDSGLIDLKALAARAESNRPPAMAADGGAFAPPIGISAPLGALASPFGGPEPQPKSKLPLYIGGGAGMLLLLVVGVVIGAKIAGTTAPAPVPIASIAPVAPTVEPTATTSATAEASASAAPTASVAAKPKPSYHAPAGGAKPTGGSAPSAAAAGGPGGGAAGGGNAPTPPPPKKPGNDCGCNGDLMCLMKCSTH